MRLLINYLYQKKYIIGVFLFFIFIFGGIFYLYRLPLKAIVYPFIVCGFFGAIFLFIDFARYKKKWIIFSYMKKSVNNLGDRLPKATLLEDMEYQEVIRNIIKDSNEREAMMITNYYEMVEYYSVWAHQIKTPISSMRLALQSEDSDFSRNISKDLFKIEQYVEMVLLFLRVKSESTDYRIEEYDLDKIIKEAIKKFSTEFITKNISLDYKVIDKKVITDEKWMQFVIEQLISNALKYSTEGTISIYISGDILTIKDNGIGISSEDLPRVFEYGYTGYSGRLDKKASGIGLYLCKTICNRLRHKITIQSEVGKGTTVNVDVSRYDLGIE